ncbi:MAG: hypothetical protein WC026_13025 [Hyphomicrobium sp.]|uniref:hypothetical protein n=1 Tax=Hyphomicrobium sp. TaxID=82 RepID=UPI0035680F19
MEQQIVKILEENSAEIEKGRFVIGKNNMTEIAQSITKLFSTPNVVKSDSDEEDNEEGWYIQYSFREQGKYLPSEECFFDYILKLLEELKEETERLGKLHPVFRGFQLLIKEIEEQEKDQLENLIELTFYENITFSFKYAKELKLYDVVTPKCLSSKTDIGKEFIYLLSERIVFVLSRRNWLSKNFIALEFEVVEQGREDEVRKELIRGNF